MEKKWRNKGSWKDSMARNSSMKRIWNDDDEVGEASDIVLSWLAQIGQ